MAAIGLKDFRDFVSIQLEQGEPVPTPEGCVRLWRDWCEANEAIRQGLDEMRVGMGQPLDEFLQEFRERNGIPPHPENR